MTALIPGQPIGAASSGTPVNVTAARLETRTEENLREVDKIYRDAFVREYIKDFNSSQAMFRLGFIGEKKRASSRANELLREPYVANKLMDIVRTLQPSDVCTRGQVMSGLLKEANTAFLDSTRVAAWAHLGRMLGMDRPEKEVSQAPIGVMMVPCMRIEDWESSAAAAQAMLKQSVKS